MHLEVTAVEQGFVPMNGTPENRLKNLDLCPLQNDLMKSERTAHCPSLLSLAWISLKTENRNAIGFSFARFMPEFKFSIGSFGGEGDSDVLASRTLSILHELELNDNL